MWCTCNVHVMILCCRIWPWPLRYFFSSTKSTTASSSSAKLHFTFTKVYPVRNIKGSDNFSEAALCENSRSKSQGSPLCHSSLRLSHWQYVVPAVRNVTFAERILDGNVKWSTLFGMWKGDSPGFDTAISQFFLFFIKNLASANRPRKFSWLLFS